MRGASLRITAFAALFVTFAVVPLGGQQVAVSVMGTVRDAASGQTISTVSVLLDDVIITMTDERGTFHIPELRADSSHVRLVFRRIGYATTARDILIPDDRTSINVDVLLPRSATGLEQIIIEGERIALTNPGLEGFYQRREEGFGRYLTQDQIERRMGKDLTPQLRQVGVNVGLVDLRDPFATVPLPGCIVAYLDGIRLMDLSTINQTVPPIRLAAIEAYLDQNFTRLPREFVPLGSCGVILFWSRKPNQPSPVELGVYVASQEGNGRTGKVVGGQLVFPVRRGMSSLQLHAAFDMRLGDRGDRWHTFASLTFRPFGYSSPWYAGGGVALAKREEVLGTGSSGDMEAHYTLVTGLFARLANLRPFVEFRVLDFLQPSKIWVLPVIGLSYRIPAL